MSVYREFKVSKDGKSVTVDGKKYSKSQFMKQFHRIETTGAIKDVKYGASAVTPGAKGLAQVSPSAAKTTTTKPAAGKTKIGTMSAGRGGMGGVGAFSLKQIR